MPCNLKKQCYTERNSLRYREITAQSIQRMQILHRGIFMPAFDRILQLARMEEMDCEFVEVTAHEGARPTHAVWQGRVYHRGGAVVQDGERYEDFETATGYGTGPGLCGWNCRHNFYPFYPGISVRNYTDERLAELDARNTPYGGGLYTRYEITQMQRALERRVRKCKRRYLAETAAGVDASQSAAKLKTARQQLSAFLEETGERLDGARAEVPGFGQREAKQADAAAKHFTAENTLTNAAGQPIIKTERSSVTGPANGITQRQNAKGGIDRNYYGPDRKQTKQISNNDHGHKKESAFGLHTDVERGERGSTEEHLTVTQFKVQREQERLDSLTAQADEQAQALAKTCQTLSKKEKELAAVQKKTTLTKEALIHARDLEYIGKRTFLGNYSLTEEEFSKLKKQADHGYMMDVENRRLKEELSTAKKEAVRWSNKYHDLWYEVKPYLDALHRTPELVRGFLEKILAPKQEHTINVPQRNRKRGQDMEL